MRAERDTSLVMDALMMAVWRRGKADSLRHHSDQGSQYTSAQFQGLLADNGITCSMSRAGNVWDNSVMESFFSSLKTERTARKVYRTRDEARADVFDYIERFYNLCRRHSKLGYLSPMEFEARYANLTRWPRNRQQLNFLPRSAVHDSRCSKLILDSIGERPGKADSQSPSVRLELDVAFWCVSAVTDRDIEREGASADILLAPDHPGEQVLGVERLKNDVEAFIHGDLAAFPLSGMACGAPGRRPKIRALKKSAANRRRNWSDIGHSCEGGVHLIGGDGRGKIAAAGRSLAILQQGGLQLDRVDIETCTSPLRGGNRWGMQHRRYTPVRDEGDAKKLLFIRHHTIRPRRQEGIGVAQAKRVIECDGGFTCSDVHDRTSV